MSDRLFLDTVTRALALYRDRADKTWGMTDCISFVVMRDHNLSDALTADRHFAQAGFAPLMLDSSRIS